jgi:hypothetical protein
VSNGLVGRPLAEAVHDVLRKADPDQAGMTTGAVEAATVASGIEIGGRDHRQVLNSALGNAQDLFEGVPRLLWRWIERVVPAGEGLSGHALAEEAYRLAMNADPSRAGLHYQAIKQLLLDDRVIIRGPNPGRTVYMSLTQAKQWFQWEPSGIFRWKQGP